MNVWVGNFGSYPIPDDVRNLVKRWRKDGWPHKQDKGRDAFLGWVSRQELERWLVDNLPVQTECKGVLSGNGAG